MVTGATAGSVSAPIVPACTQGKWATSQKLSTMRVADADHRSTPDVSRRKLGSASCTIRGGSPAGAPGLIHTRPYISRTGSGRRWPAGGTVAPGPDDGTATQVPSVVKVQP